MRPPQYKHITWILRKIKTLREVFLKYSRIIGSQPTPIIIAAGAAVLRLLCSLLFAVVLLIKVIKIVDHLTLVQRTKTFLLLNTYLMI